MKKSDFRAGSHCSCIYVPPCTSVCDPDFVTPIRTSNAHSVKELSDLASKGFQLAQDSRYQFTGRGVDDCLCIDSLKADRHDVIKQLKSEEDKARSQIKKHFSKS